jgi:AcrR family transcriptional regulator
MEPVPTRQKLLQAAAQVFLAHGLGGASMDLVRQQAGVSNGSLYHHFPTKSQLADALYAQTLRDFHAVLMQPILGRASARSGVKGMVRAFTDWVVAHPVQARLLHELRRSGELAGGPGEWERANAEGFDVLRRWVEAKVEAGEMRAMPFAVWSAVVFSPCIALTPHWLAQDPPQVPAKVRTALEHAAWAAVAVEGDGW